MNYIQTEVSVTESRNVSLNSYNLNLHFLFIYFPVKQVILYIYI